MSEKTMWMVRAGEAAYAIENFSAKGVVDIVSGARYGGGGNRGATCRTGGTS